MNIGLSLQPFCGSDIGGFVGSGDAQIYRRWMGVGAFHPFCRQHSSGVAKEPWVFDSATLNESRTAIQRRYRLLPYIYTLFRESSINGLPVMRPAFFADPADRRLRSEFQTFLLGADLLVVSSLYQNGSPAAVEPNGDWRRIYLIDKTKESTVNQPALKIRAGAIIPAGRLVQHTGAGILDTLTLFVCPNASWTATGALYEDAGDGFGYKTGDYLHTRYRARPCAPDSILVSIDSAAGNRARPARPAIVNLVLRDTVFKGTGSEAAGIRVYCPGALVRVRDLQPKPAAARWSIITNEKRIAVRVVGDMPCRVNLYTVDGRLLGSVAGKGAGMYLPVAPLKPGMYVVSLRFASKSVTRKVVMK
jgi:alpha-glucosidase